MAKRSAPGESENEKLLKEIRQKFDYGTSEWADIRREGTKDMQYLAGNPWDPKDKRKREQAGRPCLALDELGQYVNQVVNDWRQNKRGIKVSPAGNGANDKTAAFRQGKIRDIEYRSNAQQAYTAMGENMLSRSYGFMRVKPQYVGDRSCDQELIEDPIVNPDLVTPEPDHLRPDGTDLKWLFYHEDHNVEDFKRDWPKAQVTSFGSEQRKIAGSWVQGTKIRVAEYWLKKPGAKKVLHMLQMPGKPRPVGLYEDEIEAQGIKIGGKIKSLKSREVETFQVMKYLTNGVEILETNKWPGPSIPFVTCYGKILYIDGKKQILSITRLARDPYMLYCYIRSCEMEAIGGVPRNAWIGYKGQFDQPKDWQRANHEPVAFLEALPTVEGLSPDQILPLPQRQPWDPPLQNLEIAAEAARRAIQAAMGSSPLPTQAQRRNEKSGVALKQIEDTAQKGSFHFTDHYDGSVTRAGAIIDECLKHYYDTARETSIRKPDDSVDMVQLNDPENPEAINVDSGQHDVTISVGPYAESEREAGSEFADTIIGNPEIAQVVGPQKFAKLIALSIKLKNVGAVGDAMAQVIDPPEDGSQDPQQLAQQAQQMHAQVQDLTGKLRQAGQIIQTKQVESASRERIAKMTIDSKERMAAADREVKIAVAELGAKVDRLTLFMAERARLGVQAHDVALGAADAGHEELMAQNAHQQALEQAQQGVQGDSALSAQGHQQALEAGDQGHGQALEQQAQAAALAPESADQSGG